MNTSISSAKQHDERVRVVYKRHSPAARICTSYISAGLTFPGPAKCEFDRGCKKVRFLRLDRTYIKLILQFLRLENVSVSFV
jgi:hypothetical protein